MDKMWEEFYTCTFAEGRWQLYINGTIATISISFFAALFGTVLGILLAFSKISTSKNIFIMIPRWISKAFVDVIRATPSFVQLLLIYFVIFASIDLDKLWVAVFAFSANSSAYIAEIIRAGILSVDKGQTEAGRSLGLSHSQTMFRIILPQAIKNILPALSNEYITIVKETAVAGVLGTQELVHVYNSITSRTYVFLWPILNIGVIYYAIVKILTVFLNKLEKKLRKSDAR